jgi:hypothetical protein
MFVDIDTVSEGDFSEGDFSKYSSDYVLASRLRLRKA